MLTCCRRTTLCTHMYSTSFLGVAGPDVLKRVLTTPEIQGGTRYTRGYKLGLNRQTWHAAALLSAWLSTPRSNDLTPPDAKLV